MFLFVFYDAALNGTRDVAGRTQDVFNKCGEGRFKRGSTLDLFEM